MKNTNKTNKKVLNKINFNNKKYPLWAILLGSLFLIVWFLGIAPSIFEYFGYDNIGKFLRFIFKVFCHGIPERCPVILGKPAAICYRCSGIDLSFFFGSVFIFPIIRFVNFNNLKFFIFLTIVFSVLMASEWIFEVLNIISHNPMFQFSTGLFFGATVSVLVCILIDKAVNYEYQ